MDFKDQSELDRMMTPLYRKDFHMKNKQYNSKKGKTDKLIKDIFRDKQLYLFLVLPVVYIIIFVFFATPNYQKMQNAFPKVAAGNSSFLHVPPA